MFHKSELSAHEYKNREEDVSLHSWVLGVDPSRNRLMKLDGFRLIKQEDWKRRPFNTHRPDLLPADWRSEALHHLSIHLSINNSCHSPPGESAALTFHRYILCINVNLKVIGVRWLYVFGAVCMGTFSPHRFLLKHPKEKTVTQRFNVSAAWRGGEVGGVCLIVSLVSSITSHYIYIYTYLKIHIIYKFIYMYFKIFLNIYIYIFKNNEK